MRTNLFRQSGVALSRVCFSAFLAVTLLVPAIDAAAPAVSRGEFLKAAMQELRYELIHDTKMKPFPNINASLTPYVQTASALGALRMFDKNFAPGRAITKGEALQILVILEHLEKENVAQHRFRDVRGASELGHAVNIAIERKWMAAKSKSEFGTKDTMTTKEMLDLLKKVVESEGTQTIKVPVIEIGKKPKSSTLPKEEILKSVWSLVNSNYLYKDRVDAEKAGKESIDGLLKDLKDPYTVYFPPARAKNFSDQLQGVPITGIGAQVEVHDEQLVIISPLPGSPAEKAGLQPGDVILTADGVTLKGLQIDDAISHVRGALGSTAKLRILRNGVQFDVSVVRDTIKTQEIQVSMQSNVGVVKLLQFGATAEKDFRKEMTALVEKKPKGIILDLRNNPGGYLEAAGIVTSAFVPQGTTYVTIKSASSDEKEVTRLPQIVPDILPVVVLVNKGSASASEIVAGALQDTQRARILGETTFGKGTVQQIWTFDDGSSLKMTIAEWFTPKGNKIDATGVKPEVLVATSKDRDEQLLRALDLLR